ncbi:MAG: hypothetical protein C0511_19335 [Hyphomicrobium sp.]|nr:hypothetical protein [Erythrobacter sp.]MBA4081912.1 hypothetical protein [Erythrobacter sp.]MBA4174742.1 hypothetical protein [Hyphomicrobium sp.]
MKTLNEQEIAAVVGGILAGSTLLSRPIYTNLPAPVAIPLPSFEPVIIASPTFDRTLSDQFNTDK